MKKILIPAFGLMMLAACSGSGAQKTEKTEEEVARIEAAQMEGRNAAKEFIRRDWNDDQLKLTDYLLEVATKKADYIASGDKACEAAFDTAFIQTVRTVRPGLADEIEKARAAK